MREPAATPIITREDRKAARGAFSLSDATTDARLAREELDRLLLADAVAIGTTLPPGFTDACERYVALLLDANRRLNLTRVTEPVAVGRLHLLDAISAIPLLDALRPRRLLDVGSGGGVPGIVLALARPDTSWTLLDSVGKKCDALRGMVDALELRNVSVVTGRAEVLGHDPAHRGQYDVVTARACAAMPVLVEYALPMLRVGGALLAWKGPLTAAERDAGGEAATQLGGDEPGVTAAGLEALGDRRLVMVAKERPTPARYPRRPGEPARRPLA